jgi:hypothetical protein
MSVALYRAGLTEVVPDLADFFTGPLPNDESASHPRDRIRHSTSKI